MASYPWERNAGAENVGDIRPDEDLMPGGGGGGGGSQGQDPSQPPGERPRRAGKSLHEGLGPITGRAEDYSDYGAGGPGLEE